MNLTGETKTIRSSTFKRPHIAKGANAARGLSVLLSNGCAEAHVSYKRTIYAELRSNLAEYGTKHARKSALALMQAGQAAIPFTYYDFLHISALTGTSTPFLLSLTPFVPSFCTTPHDY